MNLINWDEVQVLTFFFVLVRVTSLLAFLPILGDRMIPVSVRILFGLSLSIVVFPVVWGQGVRVDMRVFDSTLLTIWAVLRDGVLGMMVGFVARWIFEAVQFGGYFAGTSIGFSIASVLDPQTETQTIALAEMQYVLAALLFLAMDGHHIYLNAILQSFKIVPMGGMEMFANTEGTIQYLTNMTAEVLIMGLKLSAPVLVVILLINLTFGMFARAVPQMNVLVVSFSVNIVVGLFVVFASLPSFMNMVEGGFQVYTPEILRFMKLLVKT